MSKTKTIFRVNFSKDQATLVTDLLIDAYKGMAEEIESINETDKVRDLLDLKDAIDKVKSTFQ